MDPSGIKSLYRNSFDNTDIPLFLHTYFNNNDNELREYKPIVDKFPKVINEELYDPFHSTSIKPFLNRDSITLANIDAVFNFSKHTLGYIMSQETKEFAFATIDDAPGDFTQYILFRNPNSYGYGISSNKFDNSIDQTHFNILTGDINKNYKDFVDFVKSVEATGVNVVIGNYKQEISSYGYLIRLLTALNIISSGGDFICKIKLDNMEDLLYITSKCFEKITLFKPISTSAYDDIYYVIAQNANKNNLEIISYLESRINTKKFFNELPASFVRWLNDFSILMHSYYKFLDQKRESNKLYDVYKCKAMWNLPLIEN